MKNQLPPLVVHGSRRVQMQSGRVRIFGNRSALAGLAACALPLCGLQAANVSCQLTATSGDWSTTTWNPTTIGSILAGDFAFYAGTSDPAAITLDTPVTLGALSIGTVGTKAWTINASGGNAFTFDGTGINGSNNFFGNIGVAAVGSRGAAANLTVNPDILLTNTNLDMGNTNSGTLTVGGNIAASTAQTLNFRGGGSGVVTVNGSIGASGSDIVITGQRGSGGTTTINGTLGSSVASVSVASSTLVLSGANTSYAGITTVTGGNLQGLNIGATNVLEAFGTGQINLNGGTLQLRANGSGSNQTIITGDGATGNDVVVGGNASISADRVSANSGNVFRFNNLTLGASTLTISGGNAYSVEFAGTISLGGNTTLTTASIATKVAGAISGGTNAVTVAGNNAIEFNNPSNSFTGGLTVNGGTARTTVANVLTGTPFGTGPITINGVGGPVSAPSAAMLSLVPNAAGATSLTGGTEGGSQFSFSGTAYVNLTRFDASSPLTFTFGPGSGTVMNRIGTGVLIFSDNTSSAPANLGVAGGNNFLVSGDAPMVTNGMVAPYFLGARNGGTGDANFLTYDAILGFKPVGYDKSNVTSGWAATDKVLLTGTRTITTSQTAYALKTSTLTLDPGVTVTLGDGTNPAGLIALENISGGTIDFGGSEGVIYMGQSRTISSVIAGSGGITKTQYAGTNGALTLSGLNTYTGTTTVNNGTLILNNAGNQSFGGLNGPGSLTQAGVGTLTFTQAAGGNYNLGTLTANAGTGVFTLNGGAGSATTIAGFAGSSGSTLVFAGDATSTLTVTNRSGGAAGQLVQLDGGTMYYGGRNTPTNIKVTGGTLITGTDRLGLNGSAAGQTLVIQGGEVRVPDPGGSSYGLRLGGDNGADNATGVTSGVIFTGSQSGGTVNIYKGGNTTTFSMGNPVTGGVTATYSLSGGLLNAYGNGGDGYLNLGADTGGVGKSTFTFSGGKLVVSKEIKGAQGTGARQAFVWTGGTLVAGAYNATNLTSVDGAAYAGNVGTLTNGGGVLSPGDAGRTGRTAITGAYTVTSGSAALAIDIGGPTASTAFQDAVASSKHDQLTATGAVSLAGDLNVQLVDGFVPTAAQSFIIVTAGSPVSASFANVSGGRVSVPGGSFRVDVNVGGNRVTLTDYQAGGSPYDTWAQTTHALVGPEAAFDFDKDLDGIDNGLEWILGGDPNVSDLPTILPTPTGDTTNGLTLVFNRAADSLPPHATLLVEWDADLNGGFANSVAIGTADVGPSGNNPTVDIDAPSVGKVTVNIPAANAAPGGMIFARLKATQP